MINGILILVCSFLKARFTDNESATVSLETINEIKKVLEKTFEEIGSKDWYSFEEFCIFDLRGIFAGIENTAIESTNIDTCTIQKDDVKNYLNTLAWRFIEV